MGNKKRRKNIYQHTHKKRAVPDNMHVEMVDNNISESQILLNSSSFFKVTNLKAAIIIAVLGIAVFFTGFNNPFMGDDMGQIVNNPTVHSIQNIKLFFEGSTFYDDTGAGKLAGSYYRPLMTTTFSMIYTLFGVNTFPYHVVQIALCIINAFLLFVVFRHFFKSFTPMLPLALAIIFMVHPLNSQIAFAIPTLQDSLYFLFGLLSLLLLIKSSTSKGLMGVALLLFLALLSKESGIYFIIIDGLYLLLFNRKRVLLFIGIMILPIALYLTLKINAVGFTPVSNIAPIDRASLIERIITAPSIISSYIGKLILPIWLSSGYYWVNTSFSIAGVLIPILIDLVFIGIFIYLSFLVRKRLSNQYCHIYLFFGLWTIIGVLPYLQIIPLDMTFAENWFYFSTAGFLGMIGLAVASLLNKVNPKILITILIVIVSAFGIRTAIRGTEWSSIYNRATHDLQASKENYVAYQDLAYTYGMKGDFNKAKDYQLKAISIYPFASNYSDLGLILTNLKEYDKAIDAYNKSLTYDNNVQPTHTYEGICQLMLVHGDITYNIKFAENSTKKFPHDYVLWICLALMYEQYGDNNAAKQALVKAEKYGLVPMGIKDGINNNQPFSVNIPNISQTIKINSTSINSR